MVQNAGLGAAATGSLIDLRPDEQAFLSEPAVLNLSDPGPFMSPAYTGRDRTGRSRQSSLSSQASVDAHMYSPVAAATARAVRQYAMPSDAESNVGGDTDDMASPGGDNLQHMTKDELIHYYSRAQERALKYRRRFSEVDYIHFLLVLSHPPML